MSGLMAMNKISRSWWTCILWRFLLFLGCSTAVASTRLLELGLLRLRCEVAPAVTNVLLGSLKGRERGRRRFRVAIRAGVWALVPTDVSEPKWQFVSGFESDVATYAGISPTKAGSCAVYLAVYYTQRPRDSMAAIPESAVTDKLAVSNSHWKNEYNFIFKEQNKLKINREGTH